MNILSAEIVTIKKSGELSLVELACSEDLFYALIISNNEPFIFEGNRVKMIFKETEVSLAKNFSGVISLRNRFPATVTSVKKEALLSEVLLDYQGNEITSIITSSSAEAMKIKTGDKITGMVKTNELMLMQND